MALMLQFVVLAAYAFVFVAWVYLLVSSVLAFVKASGQEGEDKPDSQSQMVFFVAVGSLFVCALLPVATIMRMVMKPDDPDGRSIGGYILDAAAWRIISFYWGLFFVVATLMCFSYGSIFLQAATRGM